MLIHICCSVDSHYFLTRLKADYPNEKLIGFFYNPNIHPKSEYDLRLLDVQKSCFALDIELLEGEYDDDKWFESVKGFEACPEKGDRCAICFDGRFEASAKKAAEIKEKSFTSTLLQSPLKDKGQLQASLSKISGKYGVDFVFVDYLSKGGMEAQNQAAKTAGLYRQNYCGCTYGLINQKSKNGGFIFEGISELAKRPLPASAEDRIRYYSQNSKEVFRARFLDYRCLSGAVYANNILLPSYPLLYSTSQKESFGTRPTAEEDDVLYLNKDGTRLVRLSKLNKALSKNYESVKELIFAHLRFEEEMKLRGLLASHPFDLSPIFIVDEYDKSASYKIELRFRTEYSSLEV